MGLLPPCKEKTENELRKKSALSEDDDVMARQTRHGEQTDQLQRDPLDLRAGGALNFLASGDRAGEGDLVHQGVRYQGRTSHRPVAADHVDNP